MDYNLNFKKHCSRSGELQTDLEHYNCCVGSGKRTLTFRYLNSVLYKKDCFKRWLFKM